VFSPPAANIVIAPTTAVIRQKSSLLITINAVGGKIAARGGWATASITEGPGSFAGKHTCHYPGGRPTGSCTILITSSTVGTTVVSASSTIPLVGLSSIVAVKRSTGTTGNSAPARTTWVVDAKPAIGIDIRPRNQTVSPGGNAVFRVIVTNPGQVTLSRVTVKAPMVPDCSKSAAEISALAALPPGASLTYLCKLRNVTASLTNTVTVGVTFGVGTSRPQGKWTASAGVSLPSDTARKQEGIGLRWLIKGDLRGARDAFLAAFEAYPTYHNVDEISHVVLPSAIAKAASASTSAQRQGILRDTIGLILASYSWGIPPDSLRALRKEFNRLSHHTSTVPTLVQ
jgi:hypothetical protein